jgi:predicted aspartyl protease
MPRVRIDLFLPGFTAEWKTVRFLIDTGASTTCLLPRDAPLVGITANQLADPRLWLVQEP